MFITIIVGVVCLGAGFGFGRVKNAAKLAAVQAELDKVKTFTVNAAQQVKSKL